ncbi:hypothetical protein [Undibacterium terreum]|uniref:Uncharacterized protein n=1 Tax=Undibacterium terreum TaxID=1224302 RepID=A0A916XRX2_9BURK|nr:hypothetical protein [Undibacterium terreum]GGC99888.1 hypothetical protein GCM10011396_54260 [Undibacterium terreum]
MRQVKLYQIAYSEQILANMEAGYSALNITDNPRADWREYYPIRNFLLSETLDEECFYGFFSPKFRAKTGLSHAQTVQFILSSPADTDVITFSPQADMGAFFLNVFEQNELFDQGFTQTGEDFLAAIGKPLRLAGLIMDSRHIVFSNFFVARPAFWRQWLQINEAMYAICEGPDSELKARLCHTTSYEDVERKVFLMERIASLLLKSNSDWKVWAYNTFACAWSSTRLNQFEHEAVVSDALKMAMNDNPNVAHYLTAFNKIRDVLR